MGGHIALVHFGYSAPVVSRSRAHQLSVSINILADLSGTNKLLSFLIIPLWTTEHEAGLLVGEIMETEIGPKNPEAFVGRKSGATTMKPVAETNAG